MMKTFLQNKKFNYKNEILLFFLIYLFLFTNAYITHDSIIAVCSAFCGLTYTLLAGKGNPLCYIIGISGSFLYVYLSFKNHLWGNLCLYAFYFIPMQIIGFFKWNKNLQKNKFSIIKQYLPLKEISVSLLITTIISVLSIYILYILKDTNPIIDGITTAFSLLGMYYTVRRAIEQWYIWGAVNILSFIMWLVIAIKGTQVYSTVFMWFIYSILSVYFYYSWKKELKAA